MYFVLCVSFVFVLCCAVVVLFWVGFFFFFIYLFIFFFIIFFFYIWAVWCVCGFFPELTFCFKPVKNNSFFRSLNLNIKLNSFELGLVHYKVETEKQGFLEEKK